MATKCSAAGVGSRDPSWLVVLRDGRRLRLPQTLAAVFHALAADARRPLRVGEADDGLVAFKSAGQLLPVLTMMLQRSFRRRTLLRNISALRRRLDRELPAGSSLVQSNRWLGWRVALPRGFAAAAPLRRPRHGTVAVARRPGDAARQSERGTVTRAAPAMRRARVRRAAL